MGHCIFNLVFFFCFLSICLIFFLFSKYWKIIDANKNIPVDVVNIQ